MSEESGKKQRILIVDDSKVIRVTARKILQDHFETVEAVDGENAWEILGCEEPFSLVVSDLTMPSLDGYGLLERIRSSHLPHVQNIPVIVITGSNDSATVKERATTAGATDFIGKPFDSVDLLARTQAHASAHTTARALTEETITLEAQITTDPLTGLANETAFMDQGYQQLSYAVRHKTRLAVFRIEIDDFGELFKQHGQEISESIIKTVATVLQSSIRHEDRVARTGTARFALLLPGMNKTGIRNLADRINRDISARILKQGEARICITASIGVAAPDILRDTRFDELLSTADSRLVYAASRGGDQVILDDSRNGAPPAVVQYSCTVEEIVPEAPEETVSSIPEPAENELQLEEIVAFEIDETPDETIEELTLTDDQLPAVENLVTSVPGNQPVKFGGPVPDMVAASASKPEADSNNSQDKEVPGVPANTQETVQGIKAIGIPDHIVGETIVIGVPGNDFMPYEHTSESPHPPATPDRDAETGSLSVANDEDASNLHDMNIEKRRGFFKRLLSGIGSIFRRSGKS
jgi:diguanylate cyclase (GGDEF)-like protein